METVYLIELRGQGDVEQKFVNQETWDWIISDDQGRGPDAEEHSWLDQLVPQSVKDFWKKHYDIPYEDEPIMLTSGSWGNDRALMSPSTVDVDFTKVDWHDLRNSLLKQGFKLSDEEYDGYIY